MALDGAENLEVLCCGASALCVMGLISRSTMNIDVLGIVSDDRDLIACRSFSPAMELAITNAAMKLGLADDWFNGSASALIEPGIPEGSLERARKHRREFGPCLRVCFLDRRDQVALKLFAAMDPKDDQRHLRDLDEIASKEEEVRHALQWMHVWKTSKAFRDYLSYLVKGLSFEDLSKS